MRKFILSILLFSISSFALSLSQVRAELKTTALAQDSVEMSIRTTVNSSVGKQTISIYMVKKGAAKIYTEMKAPFISQRSIVNGSRMKVVDLKTNKVQILPYNGEVLGSKTLSKINPLDTGDWQEPVFVSENLYKITGSKGTVYYNSKSKRIEKFESGDAEKSSFTTFTYDAENNLKTMEVSVIAGDMETKVTTEILALRSSKKFPDKLFDF